MQQVARLAILADNRVNRLRSGRERARRRSLRLRQNDFVQRHFDIVEQRGSRQAEQLGLHLGISPRVGLAKRNAAEPVVRIHVGKPTSKADQQVLHHRTDAGTAARADQYGGEFFHPAAHQHTDHIFRNQLLH